VDITRRCCCGHSVIEHGERCSFEGCGCRRDRFDALESALDLAAEERLAQAAPPHRLRLAPKRHARMLV
jgi:hypothetical protein